jgi:hypothetical protein
MPRTTKAQTQADAIYVAERFFEASLALEDDTDLDGSGLLEEEDLLAAELLADDISEVLELAALNWTEIARYMVGDGSRGPYNQIPKSVDFFSVCLQAPDREFRHMFRYVGHLFSIFSDLKDV